MKGKDEIITFRATSMEKKIMEEVCSNVGMNVSDFVRRCVFQYIAEGINQQLITPELRELAIRNLEEMNLDVLHKLRQINTKKALILSGFDNMLHKYKKNNVPIENVKYNIVITCMMVYQSHPKSGSSLNDLCENVRLYYPSLLSYTRSIITHIRKIPKNKFIFDDKIIQKKLLGLNLTKE